MESGRFVRQYTTRGRCNLNSPKMHRGSDPESLRLGLRLLGRHLRR